MPKEVIHISEAEAASNFASLLARVREGAEIVIEIDARPIAVVRPAESPGPGRLLSESLAIAEARGSKVTLNGGHNPRRGAFGESFISELLAGVEVYPFTRETVLLVIPFADLLIGATALEVGYSLLTASARHFRLIPGLTVTQL